MSGDGWMILAVGWLFLLAVFSGAIADWWKARRGRRAASALTRLWDDERCCDD